MVACSNIESWGCTRKDSRNARAEECPIERRGVAKERTGKNESPPVILIIVFEIFLNLK